MVEPSELRTSKRTLREAVERDVEAMSRAARRAADQAIMDRLIARCEWTDAGEVLLYRSLPHEVATEPLLHEALEAGKRLYLPRISGRTMGFYHIPQALALSQLARHRFGMYEPPEGTDQWHAPAEGERRAVVVCPGRVFDMRGNRIGHGSGYYDRFLRVIRSTEAGRAGVRSLGICYEAQVRDAVPTSPSDEPVDLVVTERRVLSPRIDRGASIE